MPRPNRLDFPGARHHVMGRGARKAPVFKDSRFCELFLAILAELPERFDVVVHGFALMPNHYHLMLESRRGNLSRAMAFLVGRYTVEANKLHAWDGPVFRGRYHNRLVHLDPHWTHLLVYLHLNPVRARLVVKPEQSPWTSHRYFAGKAEPPSWLTTTELSEMLEPLGGYTAYLKEVRTHRGEAPDQFEAVTFHGSRRVSDDSLKPKRPERKLASPQTVLRRVALFAEVPVSELKTSRFGPKGNPARAVAAHLLVCDCGLSHREVGALLGMTEANVSSALTTVRRKRDEDHPIALLLEKLAVDK